MLELLVEAALRSIVLGAVAGLGLILARTRNLQVQMTAWTVVLLVSLAMPALTPWMKVTIPIYEHPARLVKITWTNVAEAGGFSEKASKIPAQAAAPGPLVAAAASPEASTPQQPDVGTAVLAYLPSLDGRLLATGIYLFVASVMLLRLLIGMILMWRVVRAARPARDSWAAGANVRVSDVVLVPVTFASTILLPSSSSAWTARKRRAVLLHERSHVENGDFYVLLLATINRAVFWFNPFAWWLFIRLADLAEAVSDDAALAGLSDPRRYADILVEVADNAQRLPAGLAMARPSTVRRRVERILAATAVPARMGWRRRLLIATTLVPLAALSAGSVARSAAPAQTRPLVPAAPPMTGYVMDSARLDRYVGQFEINVTMVLTVTREGQELFVQSTGGPRLRLSAVRDHEFVDELGEVNVTFVVNGDGPATEVILREPNTGSRHGPRTEAAMAAEIAATFQRRTAAAPDRFRDQTPMPGGKTALRGIIEDLRSGVPNTETMSPQLTEKLRRQLPQLQATLRGWGAVDSIFFRGVGPGGYDIYGVKFANGSAEFRIDVAPGGRIDDVNFNPRGDGTLGGVADCALEPALKPARDTAPIRLSLINHSGAEMHAFLLDGAGRRVGRRTLENDTSTFVWTSIARPLIVTDQSEQCRQIVLPGEATRFHIIEASGANAVRRITPLVGSEEALQRHIDSVRHGLPDYDRMTPVVAAATRQFLTHTQAILAKLGAVRAMSFRGVSPSGNDIYTVQFDNGWAEWQIGLVEKGRIASLVLGPQY